MIPQTSPEDVSNRAPSGAWPVLLKNMVDVLDSFFVQRGFTRDKAKQEAKAVVATLANYFGGRQVYLPKGNTLKKALRDIDIYRQANGRNTQELADEFGCTTRNIQRIVQEQTQLHRTGRPDEEKQA
jgi:Mor family transcriptional regulator